MPPLIAPLSLGTVYRQLFYTYRCLTRPSTIHIHQSRGAQRHCLEIFDCQHSQVSLREDSVIHCAHHTHVSMGLLAVRME